MQHDDSSQDGVDDPQYLEHHPAADSAAPSDPYPFAPCLKHTQGELILFSLDKAVVGKCIQPGPARITFAVFFRLDEKFQHMGRKAIYIKRYKKTHHIHAGKQFQNPLKILPATEGIPLFSDARKRQPE